MKYYFRQEDLLRAVRTHITTYVSKPKQLLLDPTLSVRDWLVRLKEDTQPTDNYMKRKVLQQYMESLKGLKTTKINQWLDSWEHAMKMAVKYKIPQMSLGLWLTDLAQAVRPLSETYFVLYSKQANDPEKSEPSEYRKVAMELREALANLHKTRRLPYVMILLVDSRELPKDCVRSLRKRYPIHTHWVPCFRPRIEVQA
jgi:hypothetical protein